MSLTVYNYLPRSVIIFGTNDDEEACLIGFLDSCTATNTANPLVHQYSMTRHPHLVEIYKQLHNCDTFVTIKIACYVDNDALIKTESTSGKLDTVVTYRTLYINKNGKKYLLPIGLGSSVAVNTLLGLTTFLSWNFSWCRRIM